MFCGKRDENEASNKRINKDIRQEVRERYKSKIKPVKLLVVGNYIITL